MSNSFSIKVKRVYKPFSGKTGLGLTGIVRGHLPEPGASCLCGDKEIVFKGVDRYHDEHLMLVEVLVFHTDLNELELLNCIFTEAPNE